MRWGWSAHYFGALLFYSYLDQNLFKSLDYDTGKENGEFDGNLFFCSDSEKSEKLWEDYLNAENSIVTGIVFCDL